MIVEIAGNLMNLQHVREVTYDGAYTRLFFSDMQHDTVRFEGDYRPALLAACGDVILKATKRK